VLALRRGVVLEAGPDDGGEQELIVQVGGRPRPAIAAVGLVGLSRTGDEVVVNVEALDLGLGSGGFDVVHANLTRGLDGVPDPARRVMKLNYTSLQHGVDPVEGERVTAPLSRPVAVAAVHGQLAPLAWAFDRARPAVPLGYVQTAGGALPGGHSRTVRRLRERGLLAGHLTAGPAFGGDGEAVSTAGALARGLGELGWAAAVCGPGPGIVGSGSSLGHGGMVALDSAHTAAALGCDVVLAARMSSGDPRPRHRGLSHHTATVLELLLCPVRVPLPRGESVPEGEGVPEGEERHRWDTVDVENDLDRYAGSGLPVTTMGRGIDEDPLFFASALAAGRMLAGLVGRAG
jgi:hypothetical protein